MARSAAVSVCLLLLAVFITEEGVLLLAVVLRVMLLTALPMRGTVVCCRALSSRRQALCCANQRPPHIPGRHQAAGEWGQGLL